MRTDNSLAAAIIKVIDNSPNRNELTPSSVANKVYGEIDPDGAAPDLVKLAALQTLREMTRTLLDTKSFQQKT